MILTLSDKKPLFEGLTRSVYVHYQNPDYLIKIIRVLIVKAEYDAVGNLAKPFDAYKNDMKQYEEQITDFITWVRQTDFICYDLKFDNILLSWRSGQPQLVLIDGIGENSLFSMRKYSRRFNNFRNRKELQEFIDSLKPYIQLPCFDE